MECEGQWTPLYESVPEFIREQEEKQRRAQLIMDIVDYAFALGVLSFVLYLIFNPT